MAEAYALLGERGNLPSNEALTRGKAAALKAVGLDDSLAEAHASLAIIAETLEWDWPTAEREYKRALELNPGYAAGHHWYASYLIYLGRIEGGLTEAKRERGFVAPAALGIVAGAMGEKDEAFAWLEKAHESRGPQLTYLTVGPKFTPLRSDPRFQELPRRMGLPPEVYRTASRSLHPSLK
jgi:tetratricopeptide (TPR) repeat protein